MLSHSHADVGFDSFLVICNNNIKMVYIRHDASLSIYISMHCNVGW